jgi:environmental stress-induced protein Ves
VSTAAARVQLLPAAERAAVPWKNRGGVTREVAVQPPQAGLDDFEWRVSCAQIDSAGVFSRFPGIDRVIVILEGELSLEVAGARAVVLSPESDPFAFPGDAASSGTPLVGAVHDLNVMTRRGHSTAKVQRCLVEEPVKFSFTAATTVVLASAELVMKAQDKSVALARLDALRIDGPLQCQFSSVVPGACFYRIEISAGG